MGTTEGRELLIQAGAFGERRFTRATYKHRTSTWPGELGGYAGTYSAPRMETEQRTVDLPNGHCSVELPPGTEIRLDLATERYVNEPSYTILLIRCPHVSRCFAPPTETGQLG